MSEPDNLVLVLLREMRAEQEAARAESNARFDAIEKRLDTMHANGLKAMATFVGHRNLVERAFGSFETDLTDQKARLLALESAR